jgi:predicted metal-dependent phosphoesterase TrpH
MKQDLILTTKRAVTIFEEMVSCRRDYGADDEFFKMTDVWEYLCDGSNEWKIKFFHQVPGQALRPKAAVTEFDHNVRLMVESGLWSSAQHGDKLSNFVLAHESGHLQLRHNSRTAVRHFMMVAGEMGNSVIPQDYFELEANFAAVIFQCGVALLDATLSASELARRAFTDVAQVKKVQAMVRTEVFRRELNRQRPTCPRVVL